MSAIKNVGMYESLKATAQSRVDEANIALSKSMSDFEEAMSKVDSAVGELNAFMLKEQYEAIASTGNPMLSLVKVFYGNIFSAKPDKDKETKKITGVSLKDATKALSVEGFQKRTRNAIASAWLGKSAELLALLKTREMDIMSMTDDQINAENAYFALAVKATKDGHQPASNRKIVDLIQEMVDLVCPVLEDGTHAFIATKKDVRFINKLVEELNKKEKCGTKFVKQSKFDDIMFRIMAHICDGVPYVVDYNDAKPKGGKPAEQKPAEQKPAEQKPAEQKPAEQKPAEQKPAEQKPAEQKPAEQKPAEQKPAEQKPAEQKPAEPKTKKRNSKTAKPEPAVDDAK